MESAGLKFSAKGKVYLPASLKITVKKNAKGLHFGNLSPTY